jgi:hypothetical protein
MTFAELYGISVIENPRISSGKANTVVFDAHFFTGDSAGMLAYVEYYNHDKLDFSFTDTRKCLIEGTVCSLSLSAAVCSQSCSMSNLFHPPVALLVVMRRSMMCLVMLSGQVAVSNALIS